MSCSKPCNDILKVIKSLQDVYKILENIREKRGALNLELPEKKILFDEEGWPQDVKKIYGVTSNKIIEELMESLEFNEEIEIIDPKDKVNKERIDKYSQILFKKLKRKGVKKNTGPLTVNAFLKCSDNVL